VKVEWEYLVIVGVVIALAIAGWQRGEVSDIHVLFSLGGAILSVMVLAALPVKIDKLNVSNFLMQTSLLNISLAVGAIRGVPPPAFIPAAHVVLVATATEEIFRIGAYQMVIEAYEMPIFACFVSAVVFAAMHMYWQPTQWIFAISGGALFSIMLMVFQSQTACVVSHFTYDMLAFQYIQVIPYFGLCILMLILGLIPISKKVKVMI